MMNCDLSNAYRAASAQGFVF